MNKTTSINRFEDLFQLALSIMLAAAVAHALNILSTSVPEADWWIWLFSSIIIVGVSIAVICYMLEFFDVLGENENKEEKRKFWLKIFIISIVTLDLFAFTRYLYFLTNPEVTAKVSGISLLLTLIITGILGLVLEIQSIYDKKNKSALRWIGVFLIIISILLYIVIYYLARGQ